MHPVKVSERSRREDAVRETAWQEADTIVCPIRRESVGETSHHGAHEQSEPQVPVRNMVRDAKQQCRVLHWERRGRVQSQRNSKIGTSGQMGQRSHQQCDWSALENDRWKMDSRQARSTSGSHSNASIAVRWSTRSEGKNHQARH